MAGKRSYFAFGAFNHRSDSKVSQLAITPITDREALKIILAGLPKLDVKIDAFDLRPRIELARGKERGYVALARAPAIASEAVKQVRARMRLSDPEQKLLQEHVASIEAYEQDRARRTLPCQELPIKAIGTLSPHEGEQLADEPFAPIGERSAPMRLGQGDVQQMILRVTHARPCAVRVEHHGEHARARIGSFHVLFLT